MIDSESACPWDRENRAGEGRRAKFMHECMHEPEDARPAKICSGIQGRGGLESVIIQLAATESTDGSRVAAPDQLAPASPEPNTYPVAVPKSSSGPAPTPSPSNPPRIT